MKTIAQVAHAILDVLAHRAEAEERTSGFVQRRAKLSGARFVQTLVLGAVASRDLTLDGLARMAASLEVAVSPQAVDQRMTEAAATLLKRALDEAVAHLLTSDPIVVPLLERFSAVWVQDSTRVTLPDPLAALWRGTGGNGPRAAVKLQARLDLRRGRMQGPLLHPAHENDQGYSWDLVEPGALRIADLGYWDAAECARLAQAGAYWLSRLKSNLCLRWPDGTPMDLLAWLGAQPEQGLDTQVLLTRSRLPARLVARRVADEVAARRRRELRQVAQRSGCQPSKRSLALAAWDLYVTNVQGELASAAEIFALGRARWQIEMVFKLWKSKAGIDESRSDKPWRVLCELYAKLIAVVLEHWVMLIGFWSRPQRSLFKAVDLISQYATSIALAMPSHRRLCAVLGVISQCLCRGSGCCTQKRRKHPGTFQYLLSPERA